MNGFDAQLGGFLDSCSPEVLRRTVCGLPVFSVALAAGKRLAVVAVPLDFFAAGGTVEQLRLLEQSLPEDDRLFLYEDRWLSSGSLVRAMLLARSGHGKRVFARNCEVRTVSPQAAATFLEHNHIYGPARAKYRLGLFRMRATGKAEAGMEDTPVMVAVATFSQGRTREDGSCSYEWVRYASARGVRVVGGMGMLLETFVSSVKGDAGLDVMTYADLEWYDGRSYIRLGFQPCGDRAPVRFLCRAEGGGRIYTDSPQPDDGAVEIFNMGSRKYVRRY